MTGYLGKHAIVIGGSIAGLLAGRVLKEHFEQVTIIERDELPDDSAPRKGALQGHQSHTMLKSGESVIAKWLPGFYEERNASGEVPVIDSADIKWYHYGVWRLRLRTGIPKTIMSRPYLERHIRLRVEALEGVNFLQNTEVFSLVTNADRTAVTGVKVKSKQGKEPASIQQLSADLVVDASGKGSQTPKWLKEIGYTPPEENAVRINIGYSTRLYELPEKPNVDWRFLMVYPKAPNGTKLGFVQEIENRRWMVTLAGLAGDYPPESEEHFLDYAKQLEQPDVYEAIKHATPVTQIRTHRFPASVRRHYEKLGKFPDGLLVAGDAVCGFNPVYGQGMSVTLLGVDLLDQCLREQTAYSRGLHELHKRYFKRLAKAINPAWQAAITEDFRFPQTQGKKPPFTGLLNWYMGQLFELSAVDPTVYIQVVLVQNMVAKPSTLFKPKILMRVLRKRRAKPGGSHEQPVAASGKA